MTHKKTHKEMEPMSSAAKKLVIVHNDEPAPDTDRRDRSRPSKCRRRSKSSEPRGAAGRIASARSAAVCRRRAARRGDAGAPLPEGVDVRTRWPSSRPNMRRAASIWCKIGRKWTFRTADDLSWLLTKQIDRDAQAVARGDRDAGHRRLSPAGDARRDRGNPRRRHRRRHARRAAQDRLDPAARPPQGAGPADHLRHHRGLPVAFRAGGGRRSAGPRRAEGLRAAGRQYADAALRCRCRPTTSRCATTRTRWSPAISTSVWRRAPEAEPEDRGTRPSRTWNPKPGRTRSRLCRPSRCAMRTLRVTA